MFKWAIIFFIIAIIAAIFGFTGISSVAAGMAKIVFYIALALLLVSIVVALLFSAKS